MMNEPTPPVLTNIPSQFDYKDTVELQRYLNSQGRLYSAKRTGLKTRRQRELKRAVKYARFLALLPYTAR